MIFFPFFPPFPDPESGYPDFCVGHVNQLEESFNLIGHMPYFRFSGFSGFPDPETGNPVLLLSGAHPGTKTDPMVPHMWAKGQSCPRFFVRLAKCNMDNNKCILMFSAPSVTQPVPLSGPPALQDGSFPAVT